MTDRENQPSSTTELTLLAQPAIEDERFVLVRPPLDITELARLSGGLVVDKPTPVKTEGGTLISVIGEGLHGDQQMRDDYTLEFAKDVALLLSETRPDNSFTINGEPYEIEQITPNRY